jgi:hypothetical protein
MRLLTLAIVILVLAQICLEVEAAASKDYYKVLGVPKDAGERQIRKVMLPLNQFDCLGNLCIYTIINYLIRPITN